VPNSCGQPAVQAEEAALVIAVEEADDRRTLGFRQAAEHGVERPAAQCQQQVGRLAVERQVARRPPVEDEAAEVLRDQHQGRARRHHVRGL
jgi:hypothetical protein